jgi:hypothetical protein
MWTVYWTVRGKINAKLLKLNDCILNIWEADVLPLNYSRHLEPITYAIDWRLLANLLAILRPFESEARTPYDPQFALPARARLRGG